MPTCKHCHHPEHVGDCTNNDCCLRFERVDTAGRETRKRLWLVRAAFLTRIGWTRDVEVRVRAQTMAGAAMHGVRQARKQAVEPRAHVQQARLNVVPCRLRLDHGRAPERGAPTF